MKQERAANGAVAAFLDCPAAALREVDSRSFEGPGLLSPNVYVLSGSGAASGS